MMVDTKSVSQFKVGDLVQIIGTTTDDARRIGVGNLARIKSVEVSSRHTKENYAVMEGYNQGCWFYELKLHNDWDV